jgi:hypothetical protein
MCPLYVAGLIGPGDRKSIQPMAERLAPGDYDQLMTSKTDRQIRPNASRWPRIGLQQRRKEHGNDCMCDGACASA